MGMAQVAALVAAADEIDGGIGLLQFYLEGSHKRIFGQHGYAVAGTGDVKPNGEFAVGHGDVILAVRGKTDNGSPGLNVAADGRRGHRVVFGRPDD
jgi:hypothetical protein